MNHEHFICQNCGATGHIRYLQHRQTMSGDYCQLCGDIEKCAACGELYPRSYTTYKHDIHNIICDDCIHHYHEVAKYIKPLKTLKPKTMNIPHHLAQIEKLEKIANMITRCQHYLDADYKTLNSEACNWLHTLRTNTQHRIEIRTKALNRLKNYYAKNAFALASVAYNEIHPHLRLKAA